MFLFYTYAIYSLKGSHKGGYVGFKKMKKNLGFADCALAGSLKHKRSLKLTQLNMLGEHLLRNLTGRVENLNSALNWDRIESVLMSH